jgi:hypothetical protein
MTDAVAAAYPASAATTALTAARAGGFVAAEDAPTLAWPGPTRAG